MKTKVKRMLAVLLCAIMVIGVIPVMQASAASLFDQRVSQLRQKFPNNYYWNHAVYADNQRADVLLANWDNSYGDSVSQTPCATHNGQPGYGQYDCNVFDGGMQCWGFANRIFYGIFGVYASSVGQRWDTQNVAKGDWIRLENENHSAVVLARNGNTLTIVEGNRNGNCRIVWDRQVNLSSVNWFKHAPNWDEVCKDGPKFSSVSCAWVTENDAKIEAKLDGVYYCSSIGFYYGTDSNNLKKYTEPKNENVQNIWYEMVGECGIHLTPGTKYYYRFFVVYGGKEYKSDLTYSFTTKGSSTYTVTYNANGGTGAPSSQTKSSGADLTLSSTKPTKSYTITYNANSGSVSPASKSVSCTFKNWNTAANGSGTSYAAGAKYTANANATLYAQWTNPTAGTLTTPTRSGYKFDGWFTSASGGTAVTSSTTISSNITIYAHWTKSDTPGTQGTVKSVSVPDISMNYKSSAKVTPAINADGGAKYTVKYASSNPNIVSVDDNGNVKGLKKGNATITVTVTDSYGNTVSDTCKVTVKYSFIQWIIVIVLFGWIWY